LESLFLLTFYYLRFLFLKLGINFLPNHSFSCAASIVGLSGLAASTFLTEHGMFWLLIVL
jgi:hypothetical protein